MTRQALEAICRARPPRLYFAVDGARAGNDEEARLVGQVRELTDGLIDWECELRTLFREENRGCARGVSEAITWFFEQEEAGIIVEDDCVPEPAFFDYCEDLLERFEDDPRVMHISGNTRVLIEDPGTSYFFSRYPQVWGWATWKSSWQKFRMQYEDFEAVLDQVLDGFSTDAERAYWDPVLRDTFAGRRDSWAYRWAFAQWLEGGLSAYPTTNMVDNIGFGTESTHTGLLSETRWLQPPASNPGDLRHPEVIEPLEDLDLKVFDLAYAKRGLPTRLYRIARSITLNRFGQAKTG